MKQLNLMQLGGGGKLQEKTITWNRHTEIVTPDEGFDGISQLTVETPAQQDIFDLGGFTWPVGSFSVSNHVATWYFDSQNGVASDHYEAYSSIFDITDYDYLYVTYSGSVNRKTSSATGTYYCRLKNHDTGVNTSIVNGGYIDVHDLTGNYKIAMCQDNMYSKITVNLSVALLKKMS